MRGIDHNIKQVFIAMICLRQPQPTAWVIDKLMIENG
jgi:hypothetical protein